MQIAAIVSNNANKTKHEALSYHSPPRHLLPEKSLPECLFLLAITRFEPSRSSFAIFPTLLYEYELRDIPRLGSLCLSNSFLPFPNMIFSELVG